MGERILNDDGRGSVSEILRVVFNNGEHKHSALVRLGEVNRKVVEMIL